MSPVTQARLCRSAMAVLLVASAAPLLADTVAWRAAALGQPGDHLAGGVPFAPLAGPGRSAHDPVIESDLDKLVARTRLLGERPAEDLFDHRSERFPIRRFAPAVNAYVIAEIPFPPGDYRLRILPVALGWQPVPAPSSPPAGGSAPPAPAPPKPPPTLDELLGLTPEKPADPAQPAAPDVSRDELERRLKEPSLDDQFAQALELMQRSSGRLAAAGDTGLDTQRLQEDALRKLDALLSQMKRRQQQQQQQQQQGDQQDQSNQQQRRQQQQGQQQPTQPQAQNQSSRDGERQDGRSNESTSANPPPRRDGRLRPALDAAKSAWGQLPQRLRDLLLQGSDERFSTSYEQLTEEYYKRLAEQKP